MKISYLVTAGVFLLLGAGLGVNAASGDEPEAASAPTVTVTTPPKVETKTITKEVPAALPKSCIEMTDAAAAISTNLYDIDGYAGDILAEGQDIQQWALDGNRQKMLKSIERERATLNKLNDVLLPKSQYIDDWQKTYDECQSDLKTTGD